MGDPDIAKKFHPDRFSLVTRALTELFAKPIQIRTVGYRRGTTKGRPQKVESVQAVHFLDAFRVIYQDKNGRDLSLDLLPESARTNISPVEGRPVFKLLGNRRPIGFGFRLNTELAKEISNRGHRYTIFVAAIFPLLKKLANDPAAVRVALWMISERRQEVPRNSAWLIEHLVLSGQKKQKNMTLAEKKRRLSDILAKLQALNVIAEVSEHEYAASSRGMGTYLLLRKADRWHVPRRKKSDS